MLRQGGAFLGTPECQVLSTKGQKIPVHRQRMSVGQARAVSVLPDVSGAVRSTLHFHANHCMFMHISLLLECRDPTMHGWRNQEPRQWPAVPGSVPGAAPPVAWYNGQVQKRL